jgi:cytochrome P450
VILMILGLPPDQAPELLRLTRNFTGREDAPVPEGMAREDLVVRASEEIFDFFGNVYEERRKHPRDDVATIIANAMIDGRPIARAEALSYYLLLGLAGHDTTNSTMSGALLALMQNPGELERLRTSPDLLPSAVDEMLRWISPTNSFMRTASKDYELRGKRIRAGESLLLLFASANRDEEVFAEPFSFKVDRKPNPHIAFGYGAHACLGQYLAKMELRAFFGELIARLSRIQLAGEPTYGAITTAYKITSLPICYELRSAP